MRTIFRAADPILAMMAGSFLPSAPLMVILCQSAGILMIVLVVVYPLMLRIPSSKEMLDSSCRDSSDSNIGRTTSRGICTSSTPNTSDHFTGWGIGEGGKTQQAVPAEVPNTRY